MKKIIYSLALSLTILTTGCDDFFNPDTDDKLPEKEYIGESYELYTGYMGIASCVQEVVDQAIFLEGLRGDLLEPTTNAPTDMWEVYNYKDLEKEFTDNSIADPKGFYKLIMNCNDYLKHIFVYRKEKPTVLSERDYDGLIGGALRFKAWGYLMLAKIYGEAVYFDDPLASLQDLSKYPVYHFDELIDKCIELIEKGQNGVNGMGDIRWSTTLFPGQGDSPTNLEWNRICPPAQCLLAELYLYKAKSGNADSDRAYYQKVWDNCVSIIRSGGTEASFQLNLQNYNGTWLQMFSSTTYSRMEHIAVAFYDYSNKQTNHIIEYFSNQAPNKYYLRATQAAADRWARSGANDLKYRGEDKSYKESTDGLIFNKYLAAHTTADLVYRNDIFICYYRAADIHLWLAEACAGLGRFREALLFLNGKSSKTGGFGALYDKDAGILVAPFSDYPITLYESKGKESLKFCQGVRGRVEAPSVGEDILGEDETTNDVVVDHTHAHWMLDSLLVEESCLESAGEARSYYAMMRMARRWGNDSRAIWADQIAKKYAAGANTIKAKLESDDENWFIKYDLKLEGNK